jgi:hypothetical protein
LRDTDIIESNKTLPGNNKSIFRKELFPAIYNILELPTDHSLPLIQLLNSEYPILITKKVLTIYVKVPVGNSVVDLFLFINKKKKDMYFQISGGEYSFNNIQLNEPENLIEIFYKRGSRKSTSIFLNANYQS